MYPLFTRLMNMSLLAGIVVIVILILRLFLKKAPKKFVCLLWALVALRLILPFSISSSLSAFNLLKLDTNESGQVEYFQYNERTEKPLLTFDHPGLVNDNMSPDSVTFGTKTTGVYMPALTYVWIFGVGCMLAYAAFSCMQLRRETAASIKSTGNIYVCDDIDSPFILGIVSPRIYLPSGMSEETKKSVIAHEKIHIQRRDHWWKPLGYLLLSVYWFNPLLWLAYVLLCRDIEAACDEKVIKDMDRESISAYSEALLSCAVHRRMITACPVAFGETDVKGRVKKVLNYKKPAFWIICLAVVLCIVAAVCLLTDPADVGNGVKDHQFVSYTKKTDGTYATEDGKTYKYLLTLTGRLPNAVCDSWYTVLTDDTELDFKTVSAVLFSASVNPEGADRFELVSLGTVEDGNAAAGEDVPAVEPEMPAGPEVSSAPSAWVWPCESRKISSGFGKRVEPITAGQSFHNEIDIAAEKGSAVVSAFSGTVISAEYEGGKGRFVEILHTSDACHEGEIITCYTHLDEICVGVGDSVQAGDKIGTVGSTGMSTGPHLGFGVLLNGEYVEPLNFFELENQADPDDHCPAWCREADEDSFITVFQDEMADGREGACRYVAYDKNSAVYSAVKCVRNGNGVSFSELTDWLNNKTKIQYHDTGLTPALLDRSILAVKEMLKERGEESYSMSYIPPNRLDAEDFSDPKPEKLCYYFESGEVRPQDGSLKESDIYGIISVLQISPINIYLVK